MMIRIALLAASAILAGAAPAPGQSAIDAAREAAAAFGPTIGAAAPEFAASDAAGAVQTLDSLSGENGLVLYFNRSLDWCPICVRQTLELQEAAPAFDAAGWGLAVLTYDDIDTLALAADRRGLDLALLADPDSVVIDAFGVRDPIYADPAHRAHGVPYPIVFALSPTGEVIGKFWHEAGLGERRGYATRVTAEDVLAALP